MVQGRRQGILELVAQGRGLDWKGAVAQACFLEEVIFELSSEG